MEFNNKKLTRTSRFVNYIISFALCLFLIFLATKVIDDLDSYKKPPELEDFVDQKLIDTEGAKTQQIAKKISIRQEEKERLRIMLSLTSKEHKEKKASFENWLETRKVTGYISNDRHVLARTEQLDALYEEVKSIEQKMVEVQAIIDGYKKEIQERETLIVNNRQEARGELKKAERRFELQVFLKRLLLAFPILLLGVFFLMKYRKHKYWPLFRGFIFFSGYVFFIGLIPYLPSYGGYVRYTVGIVLSVFLGVYTINKLRAFIQRKKEELKVSSQERAKKINDDTAEKALDNHMCPSCGKDFIINKYHQSGGKSTNIPTKVTKFCRHCGLQLFKDCKNCGTENFAHLPFCYSCGDEIMEKEKQAS